MHAGFARALRLVGPTLLALSGCSAPEPRPWWIVEYVEPLALRLEVIEPGPWTTESPGARRFADPLPLDTVRVTPFIVEPDGPVSLDGLDAAWVSCGQGGGACLDELALHGTLPECDVVEPYRSTSCLLGRGPRATFTLDLPPVPDEPITSVGTLYFPQRYRMIAGIPGVQDTDTCVDLLRRREPVFDCILMASTVAFAPVEPMMDIMRELGAELQIDPEELREQEFRNRHPEVERFLVTDLKRRRWATVPSGESIEVEPGAQISIEYLEDEEDRDVATLPDDVFDPLGEELPAEALTLVWRFGRELERDRNQGNPITVTAPDSGDVPIFVVVMDSTPPNRGLAFGWLRLRVSKSP
jgi:hypothetical protein